MSRKPDHYKETIQTWNKVAELYNEKFMHLNIYNETYDVLCSYLPEKASVFEIGCGPGNITRYILSKRPDLQIMASDASEKMAELAKSNNPSARCVKMDARRISEMEERFDAVVCGFCMPYLSKKDVEKLVNDAHALLNKDGLFYFSTIEGAYETSRYETGSSGDRMFVHYYEEPYLSGLLASAGFETLNLFRINYPKKDAAADVHLVFIAKKENKPQANKNASHP